MKYAVHRIVLFFLLCAQVPGCGREGPLPPADTAAPTIRVTDPGISNNSGVPIDTAIKVTFSEPVNQSTIIFTLSAAGSAVPCDMSYGNLTAIFTPRSPLSVNTMYNAQVSAGVIDLTGNVMTDDYSWSFMTGRAPTTTQISAPEITYNANGLVTVTVSAAVGTPSGGVSLSVDGNTLTPQLLIGGSTTFTIPSPSAGSHSLNAVYTRQGDFEGSSASGTMIVNRAGTTTNIYAPGVTYGADGIVTLTVSSSAATPAGTVSLSVDNGSAVTKPLNNGSATFTISTPNAGSHTLNAAYAAQGNYSASSATGTLGVGAGATSMTLYAPGVTYNADGVVTVTVSSPSGTPTGNVSLSVDSGEVVMTQLLVGGSTIFTISSPRAGNHTVSAEYVAQGDFGASSASGSLVVNQASTTTNIIAPGVTYGEDGIVTVTVNSTAGTPAGEVTLRVDDDAVIMTQTLADGSTTFRIASPNAGNHTLHAAYAAQGDYRASSAVGNLGVGVGATTMTLDAPGVTYGADGRVTVTVSSPSGIPTGDASLSVDGGIAVTQALVDSQTVFIIYDPAAGPHTLNAAYAAQGNFGATSASGMLQVTPASTTTNIEAPSVMYGEDGIVKITVSSTAGTPSGNVSLSVDGILLTPQALDNGTATFTISKPDAGTHTVSASYAAQGNFGASSASGSLGVGAGSTSMKLFAPAVSYGADGIVTVTVDSTTGIPTGEVSLSVDGNGVTTQQLSNGSAAFAIFQPTTGDHTLNAAYPAQGNFGASSAFGTLVVGKATATVTLGNLIHTYDGTPKSAIAMTNPEGLIIAITYNGAPTAPTNAGSYTVVGTINDINYTGSATDTLVINKATATVTLGNLSHTYDGTPKSAIAATYPEGLDVAFTYNGGSTAPTNAGSYTVVGTINDVNHEGSATGTLTITRAAAAVALLSAPNPSTSGESVTFTVTVNPSTATGTIFFKDGATDLGAGTLFDGTTTLSTAALAFGSHSITAEYGGDVNVSESISNLVTQTVNEAIVNNE